ncbi:MAG: helix-turn-helix transcriptional regulator, partial [Clostridia bacterium]|nr:helix-turn-helix transcriptional regulator [Clostridia bacterium]
MMFKFQYDKQQTGRRIAQRRNEAGMTQEKLAEKIDMSIRTVA